MFGQTVKQEDEDEDEVKNDPEEENEEPVIEPAEPSKRRKRPRKAAATKRRQPDPESICFGEQERMTESDVAQVLNDPVLQGLDEDVFRKAVLSRISRIAKSSSWKSVTLPLASRVPTTRRAAIVEKSPNNVTLSSFAYDQSMMFEAGTYSVPDEDCDVFDSTETFEQKTHTRREIPCVQGSKCYANVVTRETPGQSFTMMAYWAPDEKKPPDEVLARRKCILCHRYDMLILSLVVPSSFSDSLSKELADAHLQRIFNVVGPGEYRQDCVLPVVTNGALIQPLAMVDFSRLLVRTNGNRRFVCQERMKMTTALENTLDSYPGAFPIAYSVTKNQQGGAEENRK